MSHVPPTSPTPRPSDKARAQAWLTDYGDALYAYALSRIRDASVAEELVQETFLAALRTFSTFRAESELKTWLIGILRHKVLDYYRQQARQRRLTAEDSEFSQHCFSKHGKLQNVSSWPPRLTNDLERQEFQTALDRCLDQLGAMLSQVFVLRMMDELSGDEICEMLAITPSNFAVRMHRARLGLRECLERTWFGKEHA